MLKIFFTFSLFTTFSLAGLAAAPVEVLHCSAEEIRVTGISLKILKNQDGALIARLMIGHPPADGYVYDYNVRHKQNTFEGLLKNGNSKYKLKLALGSTNARNQYVTGKKAKLEVVYPDYTINGYSYWTSENSDNFICGN